MRRKTDEVAKLWLGFAERDFERSGRAVSFEDYDDALIRDRGIKVSEDFKNINVLTQYAFSTRYPDDHVPVGRGYEERGES